MPSRQLKLSRTPHNPFCCASSFVTTAESRQHRVSDKSTEFFMALANPSEQHYGVSGVWGWSWQPPNVMLSWKISSWSWLLQSNIGFVEESLGTILHGRRHLRKASAGRCSHFRKHLGRKTGKRTDSGVFHSFVIV